MAIQNCVARSYARSYTSCRSDIDDRLSKGWIVKFITPFVDSNGKTDYIEYVLEREVPPPPVKEG